MTVCFAWYGNWRVFWYMQTDEQLHNVNSPSCVDGVRKLRCHVGQAPRMRLTVTKQRPGAADRSPRAASPEISVGHKTKWPTGAPA